MSNEAFPRRVVECSFRKFNDAVSDLMGATFQAWEELLHSLIEFCDTDPVMKVVTDPLRKNPNVDIDRWYREFKETVGSMVGSGRYSLPNNDEERTSFYYQLLKSFINDRISLVSFTVDAYGLTGYQDMVNTINREFVGKFAREVKYRLREVETDMQGRQEVSRNSLVVFNHYYQAPIHDYRVNVGNLTNSNLAAHSSHTNQSVSVAGSAGELFEQMLAIIRVDSSISDDDREDVIGDIETLKIQLNKKKKDAGMIAKILEGLEKVGPIASLAVKLVELLPSMS